MPIEVFCRIMDPRTLDFEL